jgi:hypothetical protein
LDLLSAADSLRHLCAHMRYLLQRNTRLYCHQFSCGQLNTSPSAYQRPTA